MNLHLRIPMLLCGMFMSGWATAQDPSTATDAVEPDEAIHHELRAIRESLTDALKRGDVDGQLAHVHPDVVATWQNNRVVRGRDGLRDFLKEMNSENKKVFQGYTVEPKPDEMTILYGGDTGIVFGKSVPHYKYLGMEFDLENRWTATMIKVDGKWKIAAYHVSASILDNPVLSAAKASIYQAGGIGLLIGLVLGRFSGTFLKKKRKPDA